MSNIKVIKFGGASLTDAESVARMVDIISREPMRKVVVLSALSGVTDELVACLAKHPSLGENDVRALMGSLRERHSMLLEEEVRREPMRSEAAMVLVDRLSRLERLLYGVSYSEELTPRTADLILSYGERLSVVLLEGALRAAKIDAKALEADRIGILTDGDFGNATVLLGRVEKNLRKKVTPFLRKCVVPVITGYFGCDEEGHTTTLGRGGSDYSAAVVANALNARELEIWKNVAGFMSADPSIIRNAQLIETLSYREAAELAYFGAKILHPRTVEPVIERNIPIVIRNTQSPDVRGTRIVRRARVNKDIVKGISHDRDISVLKIHGSGVGLKPGVLLKLVSHVWQMGVNIKSTITSQTCIGMLLSHQDMDAAYGSIRRARMKVVEKIERLTGLSLVAVVGEGLARTKGLAARIFGALAADGVNVEMVSAGASQVACYFIVRQSMMKRAIRAIHDEFFGRPT